MKVYLTSMMSLQCLNLIRLCLITIVHFVLTIVASESYTTINTKVGSVRGIQANNGGIVTVQFLSIPYAQPPIGELRFQPPKKHPGWAFDGPLDATRGKPDCPTHFTELELMNPGESVSEDCLYLDVIVPVDRTIPQNSSARRLPVLVKLNSRETSGRTSAYDWRLADLGKIIVVRLKHRTGVLGYLATTEANNYGLDDQRLAMQWVWDNIFEFGGNPDTITLFGEAETALCVGLHVISSHSRGLFSRAITHGGSFVGPGTVVTNSSALKFTAMLGRALGCGDETRDSLSCLRNASLNNLLEKSAHLENLHAPWGQGLWRPAIQGGADKPEHWLEQGRIKIAEYMIGEILVNNDMQCQKSVDLKKTSPEDLQTIVRNTISTSFSADEINSELIERVISSILLEYKTPLDTTGEILNAFRTDAFSLAPAEWTVRLLSRVDRRVYGYLMCQDGRSCMSSGGSGGDRDAKAQRESAQILLEKQQQQKRQEELLWTAWINFIKTGNPNSSLNSSRVLPAWRPFTELDRYYFEFCSINTSAQDRMIRARRMAYWNDYFPYLLQDGEGSGEPRESQIRDGNLRSGIDKFNFSENLGPIFWAIVAVAVLLLFAVILLIVKLCRTKSVSSNQILDSSHRSWTGTPRRSGGCWTSGRGGVNDSSYVMETRSLKHLPYYDET